MTASVREEGIEAHKDVLDFYSVCNVFTLKLNLKKMKEEPDQEVVGVSNVLPIRRGILQLGGIFVLQ